MTEAERRKKLREYPWADDPTIIYLAELPNGEVIQLTGFRRCQAGERLGSMTMRCRDMAEVERARAELESVLPEELM